MLDNPLRQNVAAEVADGLVDLDRDASISQRREAHWFNVRVDHRPLSRPVVADASMPRDMSAFHSIGPQHIEMQHGHNRVHVAGIESFVEVLEDVYVGARHRDGSITKGPGPSPALTRLHVDWRAAFNPPGRRLRGSGRTVPSARR